MLRESKSQIPSDGKTRTFTVLRLLVLLDALAFLTAALLNAGLKIPLGFAELSFPVPIWQAGIGEAAIGLSLLVAAALGSVTLSWVALWLSVAGIIFGLLTPRVQGPARDIHLLLVPLAIIIFGLLLWQRHQNRRQSKQAVGQSTEAAAAARVEVGRPAWAPVSIAIGVLMVAATVAFVVASLVHFGVVLALGPVTIADPFGGAAIPEAVIAAVLGIGAATVIARWALAWPLAFGGTLFALLLTLYGLTITLRSSRMGDVTYHIGVLVALAVIIGLLLLPAARRSLSS